MPASCLTFVLNRGDADGVDVAVKGWGGSDFEDREAGIALIEQVDEHADFVVGEGVFLPSESVLWKWRKVA